jgi:hypothetical protein
VLRVIIRIGVFAAKNMKGIIEPSGPLPKPKRRYKARATKLVLGDELLRQLTALAQLQCTQKETPRVLSVSHRPLVQFLADHAEARQAWDRGRSLGHVDAPPVLSQKESIARIHELIAEAHRRSNRATDHKAPDPATAATPLGDLAGDLSHALQDLPIPNEFQDWLDLCDSELSKAIEDLRLGDDP